MKAAVLTKPKTIEIQDVPDPKPAPHEVLIRVKTVGICGSDLHYYEHGRIGTQVVEYPFILGHEVGGEIAEVGSNVKGFEPGDKIAIEPQQTCGKCEFCKSGRYNLCPHVKFLATPPVNGAFAEYITHPADMTFKLPDTMDYEQGALLEPLAIGFHVSDRAEASLGERVLITGAGCIGLVILLALKAKGLSEIYVSDVLDNRLAMARELGAREVFRADRTDPVKEILKRTDGRGADIVIEASGNPKAIAGTVDAVRRGGKILMLGYAPTDSVEFDFKKLIFKEASLNTSRRYCNMYPLAIDAVANGLVDISKCVTHRWNFDQASVAMDFSINNKQEITKGVIQI